MWDAETGVVILGPLEGHTSFVYSIAFSQDSRHIVSGLWDQTIQVWDAETGEIVLGPLKGHTSYVNSVAFSRDSRRIVSGSYHYTIRVWDAETRDVSGPMQGHTVAIPHDFHIVPGSENNTSHISLFSNISNITD